MIDAPKFLFSGKTWRQVFIYVFFGALINGLGYALYLFLTYFWGTPKLTITALYFVGASIGFFVNRRFTFRHDGDISFAGARYLLAHVAGYLLNLVLLLLFVDLLNFPHQIVQAIAVVVVAIFLFVVLRVFVFAPILTVTRVARE